MASTSGIRSIDQILSEADSRSGSKSDELDLQGMLDQIADDGTYLSRDVLQLLVYAIYGPDAHVPQNAKVYHTVDSVFAMQSLFEPISTLYRQIDFLVKYLGDPNRGDGGRKLIEGFIIAIRQIPGIWEAVLPKDEFKRAWQLIGLSVHFPYIEPPQGVRTFRDYFDKMFPRPQTIQGLPDFNINLLDILGVDIKIKTTTSLSEHLELESDTLKILVISPLNLYELREYKNNRAAQALGISSLGEEILYTCHALYGRDQLFREATALGFLQLDTEVSKAWGPHILQLSNAKPFVLSDRTRKLHSEIERRRAWWPSLIRDIRKQAKAQPFLFYGGALAIFFGILQSIQTITSIWSLVLAIKA